MRSFAPSKKLPSKEEPYPRDLITGTESGTPQKFNMEPEKKSLEKEIPFGNQHFQVLC